jgi:dGTPase
MDGSIREELEAIERQALSPFAVLSANSKGRERDEAEDPIRLAFQRDRDRILHSKAFRRLKDKTQVFLSPTGDHYRTRLTHTLEVAQIGRTIARGLRLNEDLTEAIALGHDLGHTPFGHAGEVVLNELLPGGFRHEEQSLRVVRLLEREGRGLNLTVEVLDGIRRHSKGRDGRPLGMEDGEGPLSLEARILRVADLIAYVNHDIDDALRGGLLAEGDLPAEPRRILGETHSQRIGTAVGDVIQASRGVPEIRMGAAVEEALLALRGFLFERVYVDPRSRREFEKAAKVVRELYAHYLARPEEIPAEIRRANAAGETGRAACDFLAGMTDRYALGQYRRLFLPHPWPVR